MIYAYLSASSKKRRLWFIFITFLANLFLIWTSLCEAFVQRDLALWVYSGFSTLASLLFFVMGSFVWLYARDRFVSTILLCFSWAMAATFVGANRAFQPESRWLGFLEVAGAQVAMASLVLLLCLFPRNVLSLSRLVTSESDHAVWIARLALLVKCYLFILVGLCLVNSISAGDWFILEGNVIGIERGWRRLLLHSSYVFALLGLPGLSIFVYHQLKTIRERQQFRLLLYSIVFALGPIVFLTLLPEFFGIELLPGHIALIIVIFFPLVFMYVVLRYQILVMDAYIRRALAAIVGCIFLALFSYALIAFCDTYLGENLNIYSMGSVIIVVVILSPTLWNLARYVTEHLFFTEFRYYRRLIEEPTFLTKEPADLHEAARMITAAALHTFEVAHVCLFVLDERSGHFQVQPPCGDGPEDIERRSMEKKIACALRPDDADALEGRLEAYYPSLHRLAEARRPLLLSEVMRSEEGPVKILSRLFVVESTLREDNWLLAPVYAQGKMIGVLVLGTRHDRQTYAGPDFEAVQGFLARFAPVLETARWYVRASQHASLLNSLYSASILSGYGFNDVDEVAQMYAKVAADATSAHVEIWRYDQQKHVMRTWAVEGSCPGGSVPAIKEKTFDVQENDWRVWFYGGKPEEDAIGAPSFIKQQVIQPASSLACLPLQKNNRRLGIMILTYSSSNQFSQSERQILEMFAEQCSGMLENVRITSELLTAYERQQELDTLKDQFITTASHELRTPLTTMQGYIELLCDRTHSISQELFLEFAEKARLGCDELVLLVNNIIDASTLKSDRESVNPRVLCLEQVVKSVLEILEVTIEHEKRDVLLSVEPTLYVWADETRLRQILLNILTNALRYSPAGYPIEVYATWNAQQAQLSVRDYGPGIDPQDQSRLFERFTRLERNMNSIVRGAGLGLYISKQLVEAMGGSIWIESTGTPGEGSTFCFTLPLPPADP